MILLDTNVISELMRTVPEPAVVNWLNRQDAREVVLSTVSIAEISYGIQCLADGQRKRSLAERFERFLSAGFSQRVLDFDESAALAYGELMAWRRSIGRPMGILDGQIAAIARVRGCAIATRNTADFAQAVAELINPWTSTGPQ